MTSLSLVEMLTLAEVQMTEQRLALAQELDAAHEAGEHLTAEELSSRALGADVGLATVYRNLDTWTRMGFVSQVDVGEGRRRFEVRKPSHGHVVNVIDGTVTEFALPMDFIKATAESLGKTAVEVTMTIFVK